MLVFGIWNNSKGYRVYNNDSGKVEITRTLQLAEKSRQTYNEVNDHQYGLSYRHTHVYSDAPDDENYDVGHINPHGYIPEDSQMEVDEAEKSTLLSNNTLLVGHDPSSYGITTMEVDDHPNGDASHSANAELLSLQEANVVVPRGRYDPDFETLISGTNNTLREHRQKALLQSTHFQQIVPHEREFEDPPQTGNRKSKRQRIAQEQANLSYESPETYKEAIEWNESQHRMEAIKSELVSLATKCTWKLTYRTLNKNIIGCKWIFTIKRDEKEKIQRYKARLVAQGFRQIPGVDFKESYSPVAIMNSIRIFLALCCHMRYEIYHLQIKEKPLWSQTSIGNLIQNNLYGVYCSTKFKRCLSDSCIFSQKDPDGYIYIALSKLFQLKELGRARFILGMELSYSSKDQVLSLSQEACINRLVYKFNQQSSAPVYNSSVVSQKLKKCSAKDPDMENRPYRSLIGSLLYVAISTGPDVGFAVCQLSRFLNNPTTEHWKAEIRVLRYLMTTSKLGFSCKNEKDKLQISAYTDSDWASNQDDRRSTSGIMVIVNTMPVMFKSRIQRNVALSSAEAEYMVMSMCSQEVLWVKTLLLELGIPVQKSVSIYVDSQSAIAMAKNDGYQSRAKYVDIRHQFIREHVKSGEIKLIYTPTKQQLADFLTKAIATKQFQELV
uniref:Putative polyprotein n=1 Tax=Albugo laibachii Nc14 TaxID=890382 RepID=F0W052_9STRA|nr:putative polyprotein [Albugo laibachii Nc14]|eukprot:CCA14423.1 putative polyprotein [Albugo laibachii Nc14]